MKPDTIGRLSKRGDLPSSKGKTRPWVGKLLLLAAGVAVSLGIAEGLVRVLFPHSQDTAIPGHLFAIDDVLGWKFRPRSSSTHRTRHFTVEYVINELGFRDGPRPGSQRPGTHRIVLYGDSLMFGWGVPQADRFSDLLEKRISGLEVWNHAVPGYGLDQELLSYEKDTQSLQFDEAVFFVARGTLARIHKGYIYAKYKPVFSYDTAHGLTVEPVPTLKNWGVSLFYGTFSSSYLVYFLRDQVTNLTNTLAASPTEASGDLKLVDTLAKEILYRALTTIRRKNQRMSVLVGDIWKDDRKELREFCDQNEIDFLEIPLDIAATSTNSDRMDLVLGHYDRHWNAKANRFIADELEKNRFDAGRVALNLDFHVEVPR